MTTKEYIEAHGYKVSELSEKEIKEIEKEVESVNAGYEVLDGFFSKKIREV